MEPDQARKFQYIQLESGTRRYLCLQQNVGVLLWILLFKKDTTRTRIRSEFKCHSLKFLIDCLPSSDFVTFCRTNLVALLKFVAYKYHWRTPKSIISLPLYGQACVQVHKGFKIFDLRREVVMKLFDPDVSIHEISNEIEQLEIVSRLNFATSLRKWNLLERWYEEDYLVGSVEAGSVPSDSGTFLKKFFQEIVPYATKLISLQAPLVKDTEQYVGELIRSVELRCAEGQILPDTDSKKFKEFLRLIVDRLQILGNVRLFYVFSHGDFCPENIMMTPDGMKIIDWESAQFRTALFDFYSYFFYRPFQQIVPIENLIIEVNQALPFFVSDLSKSFPDLARSMMAHEDLYRIIYYLERISMLVERERTDKRLDMKSVINRYIEAFEGYEQMLPFRCSPRP